MQPALLVTASTHRRFGACLCALVHSLLTALAGDYRLEIAARPEDFPPDPQATQRNYLHHQINNRGDILFSAHWRSNGLMRSAIYMGPPGTVRPVVQGGEPVAEFPGVNFLGGGEAFSRGNFPLVTFNALGAVWFTGFPSGAFLEGFWEAFSGAPRLIGADPGFDDNFSFPLNAQPVPYSGSGRLQWDGVSGFRMADDGQVFFRGDVKAYVRNVGLEFVFDQGLIWRNPSNAVMRVITYPRAPVPDSSDWVFSSFSLFHVGHKNGAYVLDATLEGISTNSNFGQRKRVFYWGQYGGLLPVYTEKDPLPDLPPLPEVLGTDEPFDLLSTLQGGDGTGNFVFSVSASARNRPAGAPMGLWKWDQRAAKLVKVFRFQEPLPTPRGPVQLNTNVAVRAKIGNNKTVFVAAFTGLGYTSPTTGLFQENGTNFTLIAATGTIIPGTNLNFTLGPNIGSGLVTSAFYANESNNVLFAATFRTNATVGSALQGMFAWRNGTLHSVIRQGQQIPMNNTNFTIRAFGYSALERVFNDRGMFMAIPTFAEDNSSAIVRASPEAGEVPCCESQGGFRQFGQADGSLRAFADLEFCDLFTFTDDFTSTNWHSPNWDDGRGQPHCDPPGDAAPNTARVVIPALSDVLLDQRAAPIGTLDSGGILTLRDRLIINKTANATDLVVEGPAGGVTLTNGAQMTVDNTLWKTGTLSMADGQIPASFASIDTFLAESGSIEALSGNPVFENYGTFRKDGPEVFSIRVPYNVIEPSSGATTRTEVLVGDLRLIGGGTIEGVHNFSVAQGTTLELLGEHQVRGTAFFGSNGAVDLGTSDQPIFLQGPSESTVSFNVQGNVLFNRGELRGGATFVNEGGFSWNGGAIIMGLAGMFENRGDFLIDFKLKERKLNGTFRHRSGTLRHYGDIDLSGDGITQSDGVIYNNGAWSLFGPCGITGSNGLVILEGINFKLIDGLYRSDSKFKVESGLVEVESAFDNQDADVIVGDGATLRLKNVKNIQGTTLSRGTWEAGPGGLLETPGKQIEHVAAGELCEDCGDGLSDYPTTVIYGGRGWPQFRPNKNEGYIFVATNLLLRTLLNNGLIIVQAMGHLEIQENLVQVRAGPDAKQGSLSCIAGRLTIGGDFVTSRASLGVSDEAVVNVGGQLINDDGVVVIGDFFGGDSDNAAELNVKDTIINQGSILVSRNGILRTQSGFVNDPLDKDDRLSLEQGAEVVVTGEFSNRGRVVVGGSSTLTLFGSMVNEGQKGAGNITVTNRGALRVQGNLSFDSPETSLIIRSLGSVVVGGLLRSAGAVRLEQGSIQVGAMFFTDQASLDGNGVLMGNVSVYGLASPGFSPGTFSIVGNLDQTNTSALVIEVAGTATNQFDRLLVSQTASIGGTLAINLLDGFRPAPNDTFSILEAGRLTNQFANATNGQRISTFGGFGSFQVNYTSTNVVISAFESNPNPAPTAPATLAAPTLGLDSLQLKLTGTPGREYLIETSTNLVLWSQTSTNVTSFNGQSVIELPVSADSYRFFRARAK